MRTQDSANQPGAQGRIVLGVVAIALGLMLLLDRTGFVSMHMSLRLWPFALLALGLARLTDPSRQGHACACGASGLWLLFIGAWGLVSEFRLFGFDYQTSWPLLMIAAGLMIVWRSSQGSRKRAHARNGESTS